MLPSLGDYLQAKKKYDHFSPSTDTDDQRFYNLTWQEIQLATSNQKR